jgi:hypothetical protein
MGDFSLLATALVTITPRKIFHSHTNASLTSLLSVVVNVRLFPALKRVAARRSLRSRELMDITTRYAPFSWSVLTEV